MSARKEITYTEPEDLEEKRKSARLLAELALDNKKDLHKKHLKKLLNVALWAYTEAAGKYNLRYKSGGAIDAINKWDKVQLVHEHVFRRKLAVKALKAKKDVGAVFGRQVACVVTPEEDRRLREADKRNDGDGWERYEKAEIEVFDCFEKKPRKPSWADLSQRTHP